MTVMIKLLERAPDDWHRVQAQCFPTVEALQKRGLVEMRPLPGDNALLCAWQWRRAPAA